MIKKYFTLFWHKPLYTRVATREYTIPRLLVATHAYRPASEAWALVIFTVPGLGMLILGFDKSRGFDSFSHVIIGSGFPVALHSKEPSSPLVTSAYTGLWTILGNPDGVLSAEDILKVCILIKRSIWTLVRVSYSMASSVRGQDKPNPAPWLACRASKMALLNTQKKELGLTSHLDRTS